MNNTTRIQEIILKVLNSHALPPVVTEWENGKIKTVSDGFIRDSDGKFRKIARDIAIKIFEEEFTK